MADYKIALHDVDSKGVVINLFPITKAKYVTITKDFSATAAPSNRTTVNGISTTVANGDTVETALYKLAMANSTSIADVRDSDPSSPVNGQFWITK